jgi:hypothetical protein
MDMDRGAERREKKSAKGQGIRGSGKGSFWPK